MVVGFQISSGVSDVLLNVATSVGPTPSLIAKSTYLSCCTCALVVAVVILGIVTDSINRVGIASVTYLTSVIIPSGK